MGVVGGAGDQVGDIGAHLGQAAAQIGGVHGVHGGVVAVGIQAEAVIDRQPAGRVEHFPPIADELAPRGPQGDLALQRLGDRHLATVAPEVRVGPPVQLVVQDDEVADPLHLARGLVVELVQDRLGEAAVGEQGFQPFDPGLDQGDTGALQWLQEAGRQTYGDAVLGPRLRSPTGAEGNAARLRQRIAQQVWHKLGQGLIVAQMGAGEDQSVARPVSQRDPPLPAGRSGGDAGEGRRRVAGPVLALHRIGGVARQPAAPVLEPDAQRLADHQPLEARAVDEKIALDLASVVQGQGAHETVLGPQLDRADAGVDPGAAPGLGIGAQMLGEQAGVQMKRPVEHRQLRRRMGRGQGELAARGQRRPQRIGRQRSGVARAALFQPVVMKADPFDVLSIQAEGMDEVRARPGPVQKTNTQFAGRLGRAHHVVVAQPQLAIEATDGGNGRLAHADRADVGRLDHGDLQRRSAEMLDQGRSRHPAGGAAADDDDRTDARIVDLIHGRIPIREKRGRRH